MAAYEGGNIESPIHWDEEEREHTEHILFITIIWNSCLVIVNVCNPLCLPIISQFIYACKWQIHLEPHMANSYKTHLSELQWIYLCCLLHLGSHHFALASFSPALMLQWFHNTTKMIETSRNLLSCCRSHVALDMTRWPEEISLSKCARAPSDLIRNMNDKISLCCFHESWESGLRRLARLFCPLA